MKYHVLLVSLLVAIIIGELVLLDYEESKSYAKEEQYINIPRETEEDDTTEVVSEDKQIENTNEPSLMIVAHPDDETIWGGAHLLEEKYYIVCVTCGRIARRDAEFKNVMAITGDEYEFLGYHDVVNYKISNWENEYDSIFQDLERIINSRKWKKIVVHNPDGEYGHIHHKKVSEMVTSVAPKDILYYFGRYYQKDNIPVMNMLDTEIYNRKMNELISIYVSQPKAMRTHNHMMAYENFVQYYDW